MDIKDYESATGAVQRLIDTLPTEIHACIIDSFNNYCDAGTILNCALVCRAWLPFSLHKLYSEVHLRYRRESILFKEVVLRCDPEIMVRYLGRVRELIVYPEDKQFFDEERTQRRIGWKKGQEQPWAHLTLIQCARRLTGLTNISMSRIDLSPSHPIAIRSGQYYHSLTKLDIIECTFTGILQLQSFVTSFPALSDLTLNWLEFHSTIIPSRLPEGGHALTRLELLGLYEIMAVVTRWLSQAQLVRNLEHLIWDPSGVEDAEEGWTTLVNAIDGPSLQKLVFEAYRS